VETCSITTNSLCEFFKLLAERRKTAKKPTNSPKIKIKQKNVRNRYTVLKLGAQAFCIFHLRLKKDENFLHMTETNVAYWCLHLRVCPNSLICLEFIAIMVVSDSSGTQNTGLSKEEPGSTNIGSRGRLKSATSNWLRPVRVVWKGWRYA
jgi:hypothetical protein